MKKIYSTHILFIALSTSSLNSQLSPWEVPSKINPQDTPFGYPQSTPLTHRVGLRIVCVPVRNP